MSEPSEHEVARAVSEPSEHQVARAVSEHEVARALSRVMRAHGGGLELTAPGPDAEVRFTGMCAACAGRPLCLENLVAPALLALDTVTSVTAPGARADPAALERFRALSRD